MGVLVCLAFGPRRRAHLCGALGFPIGLAAVVVPVTLISATGVPFGLPLVAAVGVAIAAACGWRLRGATLDRRAIVGWAGAFAVVSLVVTAFNVAYLTYDSHLIVSLGRVLADDDGFRRGILFELGDRGPFMVVAHATASLLGQDFLYGLAPMLGLSLIAVFATALHAGLGALGVERRRGLVLLATAALATVATLQFHFVYIHENLGTGLYLLVFAALSWLAEVEEEPAYLPPAFLGVAAFGLFRIENAIAATMFLTLAVLPSKLPRRAIGPGLAAATLAIAAWNVLLAMTIPDGNAMSLTPSRCLVMASVPTAFLAYWLGSARLVRLNRLAPLVVAAGCVAALGYAFVRKPDLMQRSSDAMLTNLTSFDHFGGTWIGLAALMALGAVVARPPSAWALGRGVWIYLGMVLLLSYVHGSYIVAWTDSSLRMSLHVLPIAVFYVGLQLGVLTAGPRAPRTSPAEAR